MAHGDDQADGPATTGEQPTFSVRHSGAAAITRTGGTTEIDIVASAAEMRRRGDDSKLIETLFPEDDDGLCSLRWAPPAPGSPEALLGDENTLIVSCADDGCSETSDDDRDCSCVLYSTTDPGTDPARREGSAVVAEEGRWYKCRCDCTYWGVAEKPDEQLA